MSMITHITTAGEWHEAQSEGFYRGDTLPSEGFIHCSRPEQVVRVANGLFRARTGLVLLVIDPSRVTAEIRDEPSGEERYPHIYGPLNISAVMAVLPFEPNADGRFSLPPQLEPEAIYRRCQAAGQD
jgi:uncharacterized protein (DUF952 family)